MAGFVDSSPAALDTLNELAASLGDDANFAATMTTALSTKLEVGASVTYSTAQKTFANVNLGLGDIENYDFTADWTAALA